MCPMNAELGRLEQVDPRLVWTHAAQYDEFIDWFLDAGTRLRSALTAVTLPV